MITALIFIIVIGVLVLVHELGHFIMARRSGMKVEEFGFGFPPRLWGFKKGETIYSINWIPFGGFVKILGEDGQERGNPRSFAAGSFKNRFLVLVAGVAMNFLLAIFLLSLVSFMGLRVGIFDEVTSQQAQDKSIQVLNVSPASPAEQAGLQILDQILGYKTATNIEKFETIEEVQEFMKENAGQRVDLVINRGGEELIKPLTPRINPPEGEGSLGISLALTGVISYPWYEALWRGAYSTVILTLNIIIGYYELLKTLLLEGRLIAEVSGPVGIANVTGQAARIGFNYLLQLVALISVNLAVLNIIPLPALDGGRILFLIIEKIKGSPIKKELESWVNGVSFMLLIALMIYVTVKDVVKLF